MPKVTPNLHFKGECAQAIRLYEKAFNARVEELLYESDANPKDWVAGDNAKERVYHCEMFIGGQRIILNDFPSDLYDKPSNNTASLVVTFESPDEVKAAYEILSEGCTIVHAMRSTTYSSCFVSLIDQFGMRWELMT